MQHEEKGTEYGLVKIHRNVVAQVASIAASEVEGVHRLWSSLIMRLLKIATRGKYKKEPIKIEFKENNEVLVVISIIVNYGVNIPNVAMNVQENIKKAIEKTTGLYPVSINVKIKGVEAKTVQ